MKKAPINKLLVLGDNVLVRVVPPKKVLSYGIIIPGEIDDTTLSHSRCVQIIAIGEGKRVKYKTDKLWVEGTHRWRDVVHELPAGKPSKKYVEALEVGKFYIMAHPFCANVRIEVRTVPEAIAKLFHDDEVNVVDGVKEYSVGILQANELTLAIELEECETEHHIMQYVEYGKQISIG